MQHDVILSLQKKCFLGGYVSLHVRIILAWQTNLQESVQFSYHHIRHTNLTLVLIFILARE